MTRVAQDVVRETGGMLDVLVATHQHTDHLSGFKQAEAEFNKNNESETALARVDGGPVESARKKIQHQLVAKLAAVRVAAAKLAELSPKDAAEINGVLDFFGAAAGNASSTQAILDALQKRQETEITYHNPGDSFVLRMFRMFAFMCSAADRCEPVEAR